MQTIDKDTNPWKGALDTPHDSEQNTVGSEPESQTEPTPVVAPSPQPSPPPPAASPDAPAANGTSPPADSDGPRERERPVDPQVASLRSMFPDFDDTVLQYVLESVRGDQDRAIDTLLGMNDPDYVSTEQPQAPPVMQSQTDLDEQLARRLMLEEEQAQHASWQAQQQQQQQRPSRRREATPYEARVHQQPSGGSAAGEKDTMTEIQEQFGKIAETGKKTFGNLLSKVKAKMQEYDQQKNPQGPSSGGTEPRWGGTSAGNSYEYEPSAQQYSFYDPNPPAQHVQGYDTTPPRSTPPAPQAQPLSHTPPTTEPTARSESPALATGDPPQPPQTMGGSPPANIDPGRLGLLPKRPVSLLHTKSPSAEATPRAHDDDDDDLEYAENPFEEGRK